MTSIVAAICMSHSPGATGWPTAPDQGVQRRLAEIHTKISQYLEVARPDVIIAVINDHFENHYRRLTPTFAIGLDSSSVAPHEQVMAAIGYEQAKVVVGAPERAEALLAGLIDRGFDVARMENVLFGHNLMTPLKLIRPEVDIPVIPIFTNVFTRPLTTTRRAFALGQTLRTICDTDLKSARVALLATGGLSHWPPIWNEDSPGDDQFLQRMKSFQTQGPAVLEADPLLMADLGRYEMEMAQRSEFPLNHSHSLINSTWDRRFLEAIVAGDTDYVTSLSFSDIEAEGGHGGHEILNWTIVMGAMNAAPATLLGYEPVREFICGMGYVVYPTSLE